VAGAPSCGSGLAENAPLPAKLGELAAALAENLEVHMTTLDLEDEDSRREHDVYRKLAQAHREAAARLQAVSTAMAGQRSLPMGRHDLEALSSPKPLAAFKRFVESEERLLDLLRQRVEQDRAMLSEAGARS
jgi:hypothetical protein